MTLIQIQKKKNHLYSSLFSITRLRPLMLQRNHQSHEDNQEPSIENCVGISPGRQSKNNN